MATYYVGKGGSDSNNGLSWANRWLTIQKACDTLDTGGPDWIYVGAGTYREQVTHKVSGNSSFPQRFIADVSGANTDGIGGVVRITGSDDDLTASRSYCVNLAGYDNIQYWSFHMDMASSACIYGSGSINIEIYSCVFDYRPSKTVPAVELVNPSIFKILGNRFLGGLGFKTSGTQSSSSAFISNFFDGAGGECVQITSPSGTAWTLRASTFVNFSNAIRGYTSATWTGTPTFTACVFQGGSYCFNNSISPSWNVTYTTNSRANFSTGTQVTNGTGNNDNCFVFDWPLIYQGRMKPWRPWHPGRYLQEGTQFYDNGQGLGRDMYTYAGSWGYDYPRGCWMETRQENAGYRDTTNTLLARASLRMKTWGNRGFFMPHNGSQVTLTVKCRYGSSYAGTRPYMMIHQPFQTRIDKLCPAGADTWQTITHTWTPAAAPPWIYVELRSLGTHSGTGGEVDWTDLTFEET